MKMWMCAWSVIVAMAAGCGGEIEPDDEVSSSPTPTSSAPGMPAAPAGASCQDRSTCPVHVDCRCGSGDVVQGSACDQGRCLDRGPYCDVACAELGGWIANPPGCWWWELIETPGAGANYQSAEAGCASGMRMRVWRPGQAAALAWCVPLDTCTVDAQCPSEAESVTGVAWRCHDAVVGEVSGKSFRLCMDREETLCDMR